MARNPDPGGVPGSSPAPDPQLPIYPLVPEAPAVHEQPPSSPSSPTFALPLPYQSRTRLRVPTAAELVAENAQHKDDSYAKDNGMYYGPTPYASNGPTASTRASSTRQVYGGPSPTGTDATLVAQSPSPSAAQVVLPVNHPCPPSFNALRLVYPFPSTHPAHNAYSHGLPPISGMAQPPAWPDVDATHPLNPRPEYPPLHLDRQVPPPSTYPNPPAPPMAQGYLGPSPSAALGRPPMPTGFSAHSSNPSEIPYAPHGAFPSHLHAHYVYPAHALPTAHQPSSLPPLSSMSQSLRDAACAPNYGQRGVPNASGGGQASNPSLGSLPATNPHPPTNSHHASHHQPSSSVNVDANSGPPQQSPLAALTRESIWLEDIEAVLKAQHGAIYVKDIFRLELTMSDIEVVADELQCTMITTLGLDVAFATLAGFLKSSRLQLVALAARASVLLRRWWIRFGGPKHIPMGRIHTALTRASPPGLAGVLKTFDSLSGGLASSQRASEVQTIAEAAAIRNIISVFRFRLDIERLVCCDNVAGLHEGDVQGLSSILANIESASIHWCSALIEVTCIDMPLLRLAFISTIPFGDRYALQQRAQQLHWRLSLRFEGASIFSPDELLRSNQPLRIAIFNQILKVNAEARSRAHVVDPQAPVAPSIIRNVPVAPTTSPVADSPTKEQANVPSKSQTHDQILPSSTLPHTTSAAMPKSPKRKREEAQVPLATVTRWTAKLEGLIEPQSARSTIVAKNLPAFSRVLAEIEKKSRNLDPDHVNDVKLDQVLRSVFLDVEVHFDDTNDVARRSKELWLQLWENLNVDDISFALLVLHTETQSLRSLARGKRRRIDTVKSNPTDYAEMVDLGRQLEGFRVNKYLAQDVTKALDDRLKSIEARRGQLALKDLQTSGLEVGLRLTAKVKIVGVDEEKFAFRAGRLSRFWDIVLHGRDWQPITPPKPPMYPF